MPPVTVSDSVSLHIPAPDFPTAEFRRLCEAIRDLPGVDRIGLEFFYFVYGYLRDRSTEAFSLDLTVQSLDLFCNPRPYDCQALAEYLVGDVRLCSYPYCGVRFLDRAAIAHLQCLIDQTLPEPLFADEKEQMERAAEWLRQNSPERLISWYAQGT